MRLGDAARRVDLIVHRQHHPLAAGFRGGGDADGIEQVAGTVDRPGRQPPAHPQPGAFRLFLQALGATARKMPRMKQDKPIKLIVDEPAPGSFYWVLVQTAPDGSAPKEIKSSEAAADTYEGALAGGTRALDALIRQRDAHAA